MKKLYCILLPVVLLLCMTLLPVNSRAAASVMLVPDITEEMVQRPGMIGRFIIPDVGINVAVFDCNNADLAGEQNAVDAEDSASWFMWGTEGIIADHNEQGFYRITSAVPNETVAYIQNGTQFNKYMCVEAGIGKNTQYALLDKNNISFLNRADGYTVAYTCYNGWRTIYYTVWAPVETN